MTKTRMGWRPLAAAVLLMFIAVLAGAANLAHRVRDIRQHAAPYPAGLAGVMLGDTLYFAVDDGSTGSILWKSDGSKHGTGPILDVVDGPSPLNPRNLRASGRRIYFTAPPPSAPWLNALWIAGGPEGIHRIGNVLAPFSTEPIEFDGRVYFTGSEGDGGGHGFELWSTDGTDAGTVLVADLWPGADSSAPFDLTVSGGALWFFARTPDGKYGLYRMASGGPGPELLREFVAETGYAAGVPFLIPPSGLTDVGGVAFFAASDGVSGEEVWKSDGTPAGTALVRDIAPGPASSSPRFGIPLNNRFVFSADDGRHLTELWATDGTAPGTSLVQDFPIPRDAVAAVSLGYTALFWIPGAPGQDATLWATDGTQGRTRAIRAFTGVSPLLVVGGEALFVAGEGGGPPSLWMTDGTLAGTSLVSRSLPPFAELVGASARTVFLRGEGGRSGFSLWAFDIPSDAAPREVFDFRYPGSNPRTLQALGNRILFAATDDSSVSSLWASDGTDSGTTRLLVSGYPSPMSVFGGRAFLFGDDGSGPGMWSTDGTLPGTHRLTQTLLGPNSNLAALGSDVYFLAPTPSSGTQLWKTDGTASGTRQVTDSSPFFPGSGLSVGGPLASTGAKLFFVAGDPNLGPELWVSDGTADGTHPLADIDPGTGGSFPSGLLPWMGLLYFAASDGYETAHGTEPWVSDGSPSGTRLIADITPGPDSSAPRDFVGFGDDVFFSVIDRPAALWKADGHSSGATLVQRIDASQLTASGDQLFFVASDPEHGAELWKTDGTPEGTVLVRDIAPGPESGTPRGLRDVGGILLFSANDGEHGYELWRSDGTEAGTFLLQDVNPGPRSSNPSEFTRAGDQVFFSADDGESGSELWVMPVSSLDGSVPRERPRPREVSFR